MRNSPTHSSKQVGGILIITYMFKTTYHNGIFIKQKKNDQHVLEACSTKCFNNNALSGVPPMFAREI